MENQCLYRSKFEGVFGRPMIVMTMQPYTNRQLSPMISMTLSHCFYSKMYDA
jgi:hypothetical protein